MIKVYLSEYFIEGEIYANFAYLVPEFGTWFCYDSESCESVSETKYNKDPRDWNDPDIQYTFVGFL